MFRKNVSNLYVMEQIFRYEFKNPKNSQIDFDNFTTSINGIKSLYHCFLQKNNLKPIENTRLYLKDLKSGSAIVDVCNIIKDNHELIDNTIILLPQFTKYLIDFTLFLRGENKDKQFTDYNKKEYIAHQEINSSITNSPGAVQNFYFINNSKTTDSFSSDYQQGCTETFNGDQFLKKLDTEEIEKQFTLVDLEIYQPSQSLENKKYLATAGIIKEIDSNPVPIEITNDLRQDIINSSDNPMNFIYKVDGIVIAKNNKVKQYKITKYHTKIAKQDIILL